MYPVEAGAVSTRGANLLSIQPAAGSLQPDRPAPQLEPTPAAGQNSTSAGDSIPSFAISAGTLANPLTIPGRSSATIDGSCFGREYRDGVSASFVDGNGATGTVYF
jgi:hypothetical protein